MGRLLVTFGLGLFVAACASATGGSQADPFGEETNPTSIQIIVQNRNFSDARLYAVRRGRREILGTVEGKTDAEFTLNWDISDPLQMEIDLLAGPTCFTREIQADPGDIIELQIAPDFTQTLICR